MRKLFFAMLAFISLAGHSQDLVITEVTGPKTFDLYAPFTATVTIKNAGILGVDYNSTYLYLSTDNVYDESDQMVTGLELFELAAGASETLTAFTTEANRFITPGNYFLLVIADPVNQITETNENNNVMAIAGYVINPAQVDFVISAFTLDKTTVAANDLVHPTYEIQNTGSTNIGDNVFTVFYLSTNNTWSADDINLGYVMSPDLTGPDIYNNGGVDEISIPAVANGNYYIIARVDDYFGSSYYTETNEANNTRVSAQIQVVTGNVDLQVTSDLSVNISSSSFQPYPIQLSFDVHNNGTTGASGYTAKVSLVETGPPPGYEVFLFSGYATYIPGGTTKTLSLQGNVNVPPGTYYVWVELNPDQAITETNYANNLRQSVGTVTITAPPAPSITITAADFSGTHDNTDIFLNLDVTLFNSGAGFNNGYQNYDIAISNSLGVEVAVVQQTEFFLLGAGESIDRQWQLMLNEPLPPGTYSVQIRCTDQFDCFTNTFPASLTIEAVQYQLGVNVVGEDGTPMTKGALFLYQKDDNGVIRFIQKIVPANGDSFVLPIDNHQHTLYYIPDIATHPDFVPTIYGKTVLLNDDSFFTLTENNTVTLEVLKLNEPDSGIGVITGSVTGDSGAEGRGRPVGSPGNASGIFTVILLNASGDVVGVTQTGTQGAFTFTGLKPASYSIVVALEPDGTVMEQPYAVNISNHNARVDIVLSPTGISFNLAVVKYSQTITFPLLENRTFGDEPFAPGASASSGLSILYSSTNTAVATIVSGKINIISAGTTKIRARQNGNANYAAAAQVERTLVIDKAAQTITFADIPVKKEGDAPFALSATVSTGFPVTFVSSNTSVATIDGETVTIVGIGSTVITASQAGNANYLPASAERTLTVELVVGIGERLSTIKLYPNPTRGPLLIMSEKPIQGITTTDALGKQVAIPLSKEGADLGGLPAGVYILRIVEGNMTHVRKVVKVNQ